jgi:hypothetical protein
LRVPFLTENAAKRWKNVFLSSNTLPAFGEVNYHHSELLTNQANEDKKTPE